jgi:hypothetical protein
MISKQTTLDLNGPILEFYINPENVTVDNSGIATFIGIASAYFISQTPTNTFSSNTGIVTYRWYEEGIGALSDTTIITGTATTTLTINPVTNPADSGRKFFLSVDYIPSAYGTSPITAGTARSTGNATNEFKSSNIATLNVTPTLSIVSQPISSLNASSENFTVFNVTALVSDATLINSLVYQWRLNGSNLSNNSDTIGSSSSTLQIRRSEGTYTIDCIVSHPNTIPLTITSSSVTYTTEVPRAIVIVERIDLSDPTRPTVIATESFDLKNQTANLIAAAGDLYFNYGAFSPNYGTIPPGINHTIYSPEKDVDIRIEMAGASAKDYNGRQSGQGGYGVFRLTLKKNVEYTFRLGSFNGFFGPTGGAMIGVIEGSIGGGAAFLYRGSRLIAVCGGGGGAGTEAAGGDGSGPGSSRAENGSGRNGGRGGDGGPSNNSNETQDSFLTNSSTGSRAAECLVGSPNFTNAGISPCDLYGVSRFKTNQPGLPEAPGSAILSRGFKNGNSGRINGGRAPSRGGGSGGSGAKGGDASSANKCGGGGGSGYYDGGEITLLKSLNGVNIGNSYVNIKLFSAVDPLPNPVVPPPPNFVSVDWNNLAAPGFKIGRLNDQNQGCVYTERGIWSIGGSCGGSDAGYIQINTGTFSAGSNFSVSDRNGNFPHWSPDRNGSGTDSIASVSYLEWNFELVEFGPVSRNNDNSRNYDNLQRISDRGGLNPIFLKDAKQDEDSGQGSCGDRARDLNEEAGRTLYTCDEGAVWGRGFEVGILLQFTLSLELNGNENQARYTTITRRYTSTFGSWDTRRNIGMGERFVIPDYYLGCYRTPKLDFIKIEYVDDLTLKNAFPNDVSRYRNVGGIQFDMIPNWKFPNGDDRNRRARENNSVEFGRAVRR